MNASPSGVLPVDKPEGPTSHDIVGMARRALGIRRIGHTGTLDPFASGLLLLCVGQATRIAEYLTRLPKVYRATVCLGVETDTADPTGQTVRTSDAWRDLDEARVREALLGQQGRIQQVPPAYSAKKVEGRRAHDRARSGETIVLEPVEVVIYRIEILEVSLPEVSFEVECSAGTYIRSIARDLGAELGVGGHLSQLRRTRIGAHNVTDAVPAAELGDAERVRRSWLTPLAALSHLPRVEVDEAEAKLIETGRAVATTTPTRPGLVAVSHGDGLLAIGEVEEEWIRPRKVFPRG